MSHPKRCFPREDVAIAMPDTLCAMDPDTRAAFIRNNTGDVCITFSDPTYVRAETIVVDEDSSAVYAILHERAHYLGNLSRAMATSFAKNDHVLLSALRPDGSILESSTPMKVGRA